MLFLAYSIVKVSFHCQVGLLFVSFSSLKSCFLLVDVGLIVHLILFVVQVPHQGVHDSEDPSCGLLWHLGPLEEVLCVDLIELL